MGLLRQAKPILDKMVEECNETCYVAIFKEGHVVYLDMVETDMTVRVVSRVGSRLPSYCTAAGKIHLAYMSEEEINEILPHEELKPFTETTIRSRSALKKELATIAEQGYAIDNEELDVGVHCVAAPIRDYTRRIVGSISISGPSMRLSEERIANQLVPLVTSSAEELSTRLGYHR
ncbi:MAG: IclR family transcriptional regulator [Desulfuromonadales bacterium]